MQEQLTLEQYQEAMRLAPTDSQLAGLLDWYERLNDSVQLAYVEYQREVAAFANVEDQILAHLANRQQYGVAEWRQE